MRCNLWAAPSGADTNPGTKASPLQSLDRLAKSLAPGQTGCLLPGSTFGKREAITASRQGGQGPHHDHDRAGWAARRPRERDRDDAGDPLPDAGEPRAHRRERLLPLNVSGTVILRGYSTALTGLSGRAGQL